MPFLLLPRHVQSRYLIINMIVASKRKETERRVDNIPDCEAPISGLWLDQRKIIFSTRENYLCVYIYIYIYLRNQERCRVIILPKIFPSKNFITPRVSLVGRIRNISKKCYLLTHRVGAQNAIYSRQFFHLSPPRAQPHQPCSTQSTNVGKSALFFPSQLMFPSISGQRERGAVGVVSAPQIPSHYSVAARHDKSSLAGRSPRQPPRQPHRVYTCIQDFSSPVERGSPLFGDLARLWESR